MSEAEREAREAARAIFAAADARHEQRLQTRKALGEVTDAIGAIERAAWLYGLAVKCGQQEDWGVALDAVDEAILELEDSKLDEELPSSVEKFLLLRAGVLLKLDRFEAAAKTCTAILGQDPEHVEALTRRGMSLAFRGKHELAREDLACAASLAPASHPVHQALRDVDAILDSRGRELELHAALSPRGVFP